MGHDTHFSIEDAEKYANQAWNVTKDMGSLKHTKLSPIYNSDKKLVGYAIIYKDLELDKDRAFNIFDMSEEYLEEDENDFNSYYTNYVDLKEKESKTRRGIMIRGREEGRRTEIWMVPKKQRPNRYTYLKQTPVGFFDGGRSSWRTYVSSKKYTRKKSVTTKPARVIKSWPSNTFDIEVRIFEPEYYDLLNRPLVMGTLLGKDELLNKGMRYAKTIEAMVLDKQKTINWKEFGGADDVRNILMSRVMGPLVNPDFYEALDLRPSNIILTGPPGTGKTMLCYILVSEMTDCNRIPFKPSYLSPMMSEKVSVEYFFEWVGDVTEQSKRPSVVIYDEIEEIGSRFEGDYKEVSNAMLRILDGSESNNFCIIGTTNMPSKLDFAFYRPGRFYPVIYMGPPSADIRKEIISIYAEKSGILDKIKLDNIVERTEGYTGAHIKDIFDFAKENAISKKAKTVKEIKKLKDPNEIKINPDDISKYLKKNSDRIKKMTKDWEGTFNKWFKEEKFEGNVVSMFL